METAYAAFYRDISRRKDFEVIEENIFEA